MSGLRAAIEAGVRQTLDRHDADLRAGDPDALSKVRDDLERLMLRAEHDPAAFVAMWTAPAAARTATASPVDATSIYTLRATAVREAATPLAAPTAPDSAEVYERRRRASE